MPTLPPDYCERVYAGVLGKIIGVYLGRPFEQWSHEAIVERFGEIRYFVNAEMKMPLVLTDDDVSGTFTFLRALADNDYDPAITPAQIGQAWLNYIIENRTILWWGGFGVSTEHTAFLRLKSGVSAPRSGSCALNTRPVAEEIGAQIFIDGWAMVAPGDPERAADLARRAASVSHDGEAIYGAQVIAAMESLAFIEPRLERLLDVAFGLIPKDSLIAQMAGELRQRHRDEPDWKRTLAWIRKEWGYERFGTSCPMVSNHAVVLLGLLYGGDDFQRAMLVTNTAGYDTDCNAGNVGCLLGIKNGLGTFTAPNQPDWRGPVADRLYLPTADGGRAITDAVRETYHIVNTGRALAGLRPLHPKDGAQFHFTLPGSTQGWQPSPDSAPGLVVRNHNGQLHFAIPQGSCTETPSRAEVATFLTPEGLRMPGYALLASPSLYPGQTVIATVVSPPDNRVGLNVGMFIRHYRHKDELVRIEGPSITIRPGETASIPWSIPDTQGQPVASIGLQITPSESIASSSSAPLSLFLDALAWSGAPKVKFFDVKEGGHIWWQNDVGRPAWQLQWVNAVDSLYFGWGGEFHLVQNRGRGMISTGSADWTDYHVTTTLTPRLSTTAGVIVRCQGLERHYAVEVVSPDVVRIVKRRHTEKELWRGRLPGTWGTPLPLDIIVKGGRLRVLSGGHLLADVLDEDSPYLSGGIGLVVTEGSMATGPIEVRPVQ